MGIHHIVSILVISHCKYHTVLVREVASPFERPIDIVVHIGGINAEAELVRIVKAGSVEIIDTGSTGRGTNKPGDGDFDLMMRLDRNILSNSRKLEELKKRYENATIKTYKV